MEVRTQFTRKMNNRIKKLYSCEGHIPSSSNQYDKFVIS